MSRFRAIVGGLVSIVACSAVLAAGSKADFVTSGGVEMVLAPAGAFSMGDRKGQVDERPVRKVRVSAFYIDKHEVTQAEYARLMKGDNPSARKNPKAPVTRVRWADAARYCNRRSLDDGLIPCYDEKTWKCDFSADGYRLPTEAEWEYACRAGTKTEYSFGDDGKKLKLSGWYSRNAARKPHGVGERLPNPWGLHDMHGNVWEWTNDFYSRDAYEKGATVDPKGPDEGERRVLRGGDFTSSEDECRSAYRFSDRPGTPEACFTLRYGFRCVRAAAVAGVGG